MDGATGTVNMSGGTLTAAGEIWISPVDNTVGTFNLTGGTVNSGGWFVVARDGDGVGTDGNFNMSGGTLNVTGNNLVISSFLGAIGQATISGGTVTVTNNAWVGEGGDGTLTVSGTGALVVNGAGQGLRIGRNAGGVGVVNLDGGSITTPVVSGGDGHVDLQLQRRHAQGRRGHANFLSDVTTINVRNGGAMIDSNGNDITIAAGADPQRHRRRQRRRRRSDQEGRRRR